MSIKEYITEEVDKTIEDPQLTLLLKPRDTKDQPGLI
jgi:hypothetical protein